MAGQRGLYGRRKGRSLTPASGSSPGPVLLIFLDGVGIGAGAAELNPFAYAHAPVLGSLLQDRRLVLEDIGAGFDGGRVQLRPVDPRMGVEGLPQSGTGQTALLTGANAALLLGRHFGPWAPTALRPMLERENLFRQTLDAGWTVAFANAYPRGHFERGGRGTRRPGAIPYSAHSAGVLVRDESSLRAGDGIASSITTDSWRRYVDPEAPVVTPREAGAALASIADRHDFTLFAHYDTDYVGHRGDRVAARAAVERVDGFLGGVLGVLDARCLLLVTSDHGNLEDMSGGHTLNDVPLLAVGAGAEEAVAGVHSLMDVAPMILQRLERGPRLGEESV